MAVLGQFGTVRLSREWPAPTALADERLQRGASPSLDLSDLAFQSGDEVLLVGLRGVPLGIGTGGAAPCPDGHAFYTGGTAPVGPALAARTTGGTFWNANTSLAFWESASTVGLQQSSTAYIHRDELDDVRFYSSELDAVNGGSQGLIPLRNVSPGPLLILPASSAAGYSAAALQLLQAIAGLEIPGGEQPANNLAPVPQILTDTAADVAERGWLLQCDLTDWVFETDATQLDQDAIGQAFGESAKGMLRGAGSFNGEIDHSLVTGKQSGLGMLRLMMLTEQGSKARAQFQLLDQRNASLPLVKDLVFYETDIMLGKTSVNTSATDVIRMSAQFIATGRIRLVMEGSTPAPISPALLAGAATGRGSLVGTVSVAGLLSGVATGRGSLVGTVRVAGLLSGAVTGRGALAGSITATAAPSTDPDFSNVSLLLPMNGTNGSTTFTDASSNGFTVTANSNAQINTAQSQWGGASGLFDGLNASLTISHASALNLASGDFTIEFWVYANAIGGDRNLLNKDGVYGSSYPSYAVGIANSGEITTYLGNGNGVSPTFTGYTHGTVTAGSWFHIATVRAGTTIKTFLNGTQVTSISQGIAMTDGGKSLYVGFYQGALNYESHNGYIDDLRITKVARYLSSFTPPAAAFPTS